MKNWHILVAFLAALLVLPFVQADVGPSPIQCFQITNADSYPNYDFYYKNNIWETWTEINGEFCPYKLSGYIVIGAAPEGVSPGPNDSLPQSGQFELETDKTVLLEVKNINVSTNEITIERTGTIDRTIESPIFFTIMGLLVGLIILTLPIVAIVIIIAVIAFLILKGKKK